MAEKKQRKIVVSKEKYEAPDIRRVKLGNSYRLAQTVCG